MAKSPDGLFSNLFRLRKVAQDTEKAARDPDTAALSLEAKLAIGAVMALLAATTINTGT